MTTDIDGLELYYEKTGRGRPLLMLHGNGEDSSIFAPLAACLARHYTVYALDSRNHGRSGRDDDFSYDAMARDTEAFVRRMNLDKPCVVGFSDGAITALKVQLRNPGFFARMALLGPNLRPSDFRPEIMAEIQEQFERSGDPLLKLMLTEPDIHPRELYTVNVPVLVIAAGDDIYKTETFTAITDSLPHARLKFMYGHDHGSYILGNDMLCGTLEEFFRSYP